ncbi:MAG: hypothetical protein LBT21_07835 [Oscillospiraceae bacterium]|jgi:hypothetical protein|nr:hypothetical protein [Oscillospiraceae bacterium]
MTDRKQLLNIVIAALDESLKRSGFDGAKGVSVQEDGDAFFAEISGGNAALRLEHTGVKLIFSATEGDETKELLVTLLDPETAEKADAQSAARECAEALRERYGKKKGIQDKKTNKTVSSAQAKAGLTAFDPNTLANRLSVLFPELRPSYQENLDRYGEFFSEQFFRKQGGAKPILAVIRARDSQKVKRLFNLFNDIYENGTSEVQSVIVVSILGQLGNNEELLSYLLDYMCDDMQSPVIQVNRYLATAKGKRALKKIENPPKYKPPKKKKSFLSDLMAAGAAQGPQAPMPF